MSDKPAPSVAETLRALAVVRRAHEAEVEALEAGARAVEEREKLYSDWQYAEQMLLAISDALDAAAISYASPEDEELPRVKDALARLKAAEQREAQARTALRERINALDRFVPSEMTPEEQYNANGEYVYLPDVLATLDANASAFNVAMERASAAEAREAQARAALLAAQEALTVARVDVAASAAASHLLDGFVIGEDGLPAAAPRVETDADRRLQTVDAALATLDAAP